jgi:hypothetical protein
MLQVVSGSGVAMMAATGDSAVLGPVGVVSDGSRAAVSGEISPEDGSGDAQAVGARGATTVVAVPMKNAVAVRKPRHQIQHAARHPSKFEVVITNDIYGTNT